MLKEFYDPQGESESIFGRRIIFIFHHSSFIPHFGSVCRFPAAASRAEDTAADRIRQNFIFASSYLDPRRSGAWF